MFAPRSKAGPQNAAGGGKGPTDAGFAARDMRLQRGLPNSFIESMSANLEASTWTPAQMPVQTKMTVGAANDAFEQEADQVAQRVMRMEDPAVQRKSAPLAIVQRKGSAGQGGSGVPKSVESGIQSIGGGQPLPGSTRSFFENRFGYDFGGVKVHTGPDADKLNRSLSARAFTSGQGIFFRDGEYSPDSRSGGELLAHELTHVVQQGGGVRLKADDTEEKKKETHTASVPEIAEDSEAVTGAPSIQRDLAIEPPHSSDTAPLTDAQVADAIKYNTFKLGKADASFIGKLRDVLGIPADPPALDEDFANAVARWQTANGVKADGKLGPDTAAPLLKELRAEGLGAQATTLAGLVRRGRVTAGPAYNPRGAVNANNTGAGKNFQFNMSATFDNDPDNGIFASCCEVRQEISWDAAAAASFTASHFANPVPHGGFPAAHPAGTFIEDRNAGDTLRYGHRTGFSAGVGGNQYLDAANHPAQANGTVFRGQDNPAGPAGMAGTWTFRLTVVDVCNEERRIGGPDTLTITW